MSRKLLGVVSIVAGCVVIIISVGADFLNISGDPNAFGWKQIVGTVVGLAILLVGIWLKRNNSKM